MAKQGRCDECRRIYQWPHNTPMQNAQCPVHKTPLIRCIATRKWGTVALMSVTNSDVERIPTVHRAKKLDGIGQTVGPGKE